MGISLRNGLVGCSALLGALTLFACSGTVTPAGGTSSEPTGEDQSLLKEGACMSESLGGGPTSCKGEDTWKEYASQACANRGLELSDLQLGAGCPGGFSDAKYACCKTGPKPLPPKPDDPGGYGACFGDAQGGPTSCKPAEVWTHLANTLCQAKGSAIAHIGFAEECDKGSFRFTKYECCDATKPPPPPDPHPRKCTTDVITKDTKECSPGYDWKLAAYDHCAKQGLDLVDLSIDAGCGSHAKVTCCSSDVPPPVDPVPPTPPKPEDPPQPPKPEDPPQPPPPEACTGGGFGGSCVDYASVKDQAYKACTEQGLNLVDLQTGPSCNNGNGTTAVKFTCCKY